jgi:chloramphenicol-sensitive protein RarD
LFGERLHRLQWVAVALAASGVLYLTLSYGSLPWIAIVLALSFGAYGVVKKKASLGAAHGLTVETGLLLLPAVAFLAAADVAGSGAFLHKGASMNMWLAGTGIVTTVPLLMFASAVQRTPLSVMGVLQYLSPSLQLLIGVVVYGEPFTRAHLNGFGLVWAGLVLFGIDGLLSRVRASAWRA